MAEKQKAEQGKTKVKTAGDLEEQKVQMERVEQIMRDGGEVNVLDAKDAEMSK